MQLNVIDMQSRRESKRRAAGGGQLKACRLWQRAAQSSVQQAAAAPAPQVEEGIPGDVIAAIMAAIHAMGNGKYTLKAVRRGKNGWGKAGVNDTTAPF